MTSPPTRAPRAAAVTLAVVALASVVTGGPDFTAGASSRSARAVTAPTVTALGVTTRALSNRRHPASALARRRAAAAAPYAFLSTGGTDPRTAARWNRCTPVTWTVDLSHSPAGTPPRKELSLWRAVFAQAAAATGYVFRYKSARSARVTLGADGYPTDTDYTATGAQIVVTYAAPTGPSGYRSADLAGTVIGDGGGSWASYPNGSSQMLRGFAVVDYVDVAGLPGAFRESLYLHELGHALGLAHVGSPSQVMYADDLGIPAYQAGDRAGLRALASQPCFPAAT